MHIYTPLTGSENLYSRNQLNLYFISCQMGLEKFILLGHSLGGFLSASYSLRYPQHVKHLVLVDPWGMSKKPPEGVRREIPIYIRMILTVVNTFNPMSVLRALGPLGKFYIENGSVCVCVCVCVRVCVCVCAWTTVCVNVFSALSMPFTVFLPLTVSSAIILLTKYAVDFSHSVCCLQPPSPHPPTTHTHTHKEPLWTREVMQLFINLILYFYEVKNKKDYGLVPGNIIWIAKPLGIRRDALESCKRLWMLPSQTKAQWGFKSWQFFFIYFTWSYDLLVLLTNFVW